mmetsp:Transcript_25501/g.64275  ORF Transcript_25501/g.64275 Transcript_25501/m.64275 type:complete len:434 (-) Transcript_25501:1628-2929(-)
MIEQPRKQGTTLFSPWVGLVPHRFRHGSAHFLHFHVGHLRLVCQPRHRIPLLGESPLCEFPLCSFLLKSFLCQLQHGFAGAPFLLLLPSPTTNFLGLGRGAAGELRGGPLTGENLRHVRRPRRAPVHQRSGVLELDLLVLQLVREEADFVLHRAYADFLFGVLREQLLPVGGGRFAFVEVHVQLQVADLHDEILLRVFLHRDVEEVARLLESSRLFFLSAAASVQRTPVHPVRDVLHHLHRARADGVWLLRRLRRDGNLAGDALLVLPQNLVGHDAVPQRRRLRGRIQRVVFVHFQRVQPLPPVPGLLLDVGAAGKGLILKLPLLGELRVQPRNLVFQLRHQLGIRALPFGESNAVEKGRARVLVDLRQFHLRGGRKCPLRLPAHLVGDPRARNQENAGFHEVFQAQVLARWIDVFEVVDHRLYVHLGRSFLW